MKKSYMYIDIRVGRGNRDNNFLLAVHKNEKLDKYWKCSLWFSYNAHPLFWNLQNKGVTLTQTRHQLCMVHPRIYILKIPWQSQIVMICPICHTETLGSSVYLVLWTVFCIHNFTKEVCYFMTIVHMVIFCEYKETLGITRWK